MRLVLLDDRQGERIKIPNDAPDMSCANALGAVIARNQWEPGDLSPFDTALISMTKCPENREPSWMSAVQVAKKAGLKVLVHQEAEADWLNHRPDQEQRDFVANCSQADLFLAHTSDAAAFYSDLLGIPAIAVPTLMPLPNVSGKPQRNRIAVMSTPDPSARGLWGVCAAASAAPEAELVLLTRDHAPDSYKRGEGIPVKTRARSPQPYLPLEKYAEQIASCWCFVSAMTAASAGRDAILCAHLGVPWIGSDQGDVGRRLHWATMCDTHNYQELHAVILSVVKWDDATHRYNTTNAKKLVEAHQISEANSITLQNRVKAAL